MYSFLIPLMGLCGFAQGIFAAEPIPAGSVTWKKHMAFGNLGPHTAYTLMARGFFRAPTSEEMPDLIAKWLRNHPKAIIVPVATFGPVTTTDPESKMAYVWVTDGEHNLNLDLVRSGCFAPHTQTIAEGQKLEAAQGDYDAFVKKATEAGESAKSKKLGIWKTTPENDQG